MYMLNCEEREGFCISDKQLRHYIHYYGHNMWLSSRHVCIKRNIYCNIRSDFVVYRFPYAVVDRLVVFVRPEWSTQTVRRRLALYVCVCLNRMYVVDKAAEDCV